MKVLGVSYGYHDASASLVVDGRVIAASAEERFTRQKHDSNFPAFAMEYCLKEAGIVRGGHRPGRLPRGSARQVRRASSSLRWRRSRARGSSSSSRPRRGSGKQALGVEHRSRAGSTSRRRSITLSQPPFQPCGPGVHGIGVRRVGDPHRRRGRRLGVDSRCSGRWEDGKPKVERIWRVSFPNSLGLVYSAFTAFLGFKPNDSECSTMALAAFGTAACRRCSARDRRRARRRRLPGRSGRIFNFREFFRGVVTEKFTRQFGEPRAELQGNCPFGCFGTPDGVVVRGRAAPRRRGVAAQTCSRSGCWRCCKKLHREWPPRRTSASRAASA